MADVLNKTKTKSIPQNSLAQELQKPQADQYLQQLDELSKDQETARGVPDDTRQTLQDAVNQARQAYQDKVTQNEWQQVAQTLGNAVAQFGAAQSGMKSGRDMSNLNFGPGIDYNARSDRAFREYQTDLGNAANADAMNRQQFADTAASKKEQYGRREDYLKEALRTAREREQEGGRLARAQSSENTQYRRDVARDAQKEGREDRRQVDAQRKMELQDLNKQELDLAGKLQAARSLANTMQSDDDLSNKSKEKLQSQYGAVAAKAGIDADQLAQIGEQSKDKGVLGTGILRREDKAKKSQLVNDQVVAPIKNMLDAIKQRKQQLISGQQVEKDTSISTPAAPAQDSGMIQMKAPDGRVGQIPADKVKDAEAKGFTRVK